MVVQVRGGGMGMRLCFKVEDVDSLWKGRQAELHGIKKAFCECKEDDDINMPLYPLTPDPCRARTKMPNSNGVDVT